MSATVQCGGNSEWIKNNNEKITNLLKINIIKKELSFFATVSWVAGEKRTE
jgi:hypothetical protein